MSNILSLQGMSTQYVTSIAVGDSTSSGTACTCSTSSFSNCGKSTTIVLTPILI